MLFMPQATLPEAVLVQLRHGQDIGWGEKKEPVWSEIRTHYYLTGWNWRRTP